MNQDKELNFWIMTGAFCFSFILWTPLVVLVFYDALAAVMTAQKAFFAGLYLITMPIMVALVWILFRIWRGRY